MSCGVSLFIFLAAGQMYKLFILHQVSAHSRREIKIKVKKRIKNHIQVYMVKTWKQAGGFIKCPFRFNRVRKRSEKKL